MLRTVLRKAKTLAELIRAGERTRIDRKLKTQLYSEVVAYELVRDLDRPLVPPSAKIPISVRVATPSDVAWILAARESDPMTQVHLSERQRLLKSGAGTCFVAIDDSGRPVFMHWLFTARDNGFLRRDYTGLFPELGPRQALVENAFAFPSSRGKGIMGRALAIIAQSAGGDIRWVQTYVGTENLASLKSNVRAGFLPSSRRSDRWIGFRRSITQRPLGTTEREALMATLGAPMKAAG